MSEAEPAAERASPGESLAAARAALALSVADVSQQIKYGVRQIAAIEADDYAKLQGMAFVRGIIRSYAKLVQLDPGPLLAELERRDVSFPQTMNLPLGGQAPFIESGKKSNRVYGYLSLLALAAVAIFAYQWYMRSAPADEAVTVKPKSATSEAVQLPLAPGSASAPQAEAAASSARTAPAANAAPAASVAPPAVLPSPAPPAPATVPGRGGLNSIELNFSDLSWVEIKQADGRVLLSRLNPAGSRQLIEGMPPFEVIIGNAANARLKYNDAPVDLQPHSKVGVARLTLE